MLPGLSSPPTDCHFFSYRLRMVSCPHDPSFLTPRELTGFRPQTWSLRSLSLSTLSSSTLRMFQLVYREAMEESEWPMGLPPLVRLTGQCLSTGLTHNLCALIKQRDDYCPKRELVIDDTLSAISSKALCRIAYSD